MKKPLIRMTRPLRVCTDGMSTYLILKNVIRNNRTDNFKPIQRNCVKARADGVFRRLCLFGVLALCSFAIHVVFFVFGH